VRLGRKLGLNASRNTLLRLVRRAPLPDVATPSALGVDDWALRKRHTYGTVLVDLDRRRPVALLPGREADPLAEWLREHPGVAVISRDRAGAYAKGARTGAPGAVPAAIAAHFGEVADRFHLLQNLAEALEVAFAAPARDLRAAEQARREAITAEHGAVPIPLPELQAKDRVLAAARREPRLATHERIWELRGQGYSRQAIARHLGIHCSTVFRHLRSQAFPERKRCGDTGHSLLDPWQHVVFEHWNSGRRHGRQMFRTLQQHGYGAATPRSRAISNACARPKESCWSASRPSNPGRCWSQRPGAC
jgi:transposase